MFEVIPADWVSVALGVASILSATKWAKYVPLEGPPNTLSAPVSSNPTLVLTGKPNVWPFALPAPKTLSNWAYAVCVVIEGAVAVAPIPCLTEAVASKGSALFTPRQAVILPEGEAIMFQLHV